jgi:hypothetical protein
MANSKVSQDTGDLKLDRISKHYGDFCAVDDLSLVHFSLSLDHLVAEKLQHLE